MELTYVRWMNTFRLQSKSNYLLTIAPFIAYGVGNELRKELVSYGI